MVSAVCEWCLLSVSGVCCLTEGLSESLSKRLLLHEASYDC